MAKHRRTMSVLYYQTTVDVQNDAKCTCSASTWLCPRHSPDTYADQMARHAGGDCPSLGPLQSDRERAFHGSNSWGR